MKLCKECKKRPVRSGIVRIAKSGKPILEARCLTCDRKFNREIARATRLKAKKLQAETSNDELVKSGWQICTRCYKKKRLSEFRTSLPNRRGKLNKICDTCLTKLYAVRKGFGEFSPDFWRRRAYSCNSTTRRKLQRQTRKGITRISLSDLKYECKPQDLADIFQRQGGTCFYCGVELKADDTLHVDHKTPLCRNGQHSKANLALSCSDCNQLKLKRTQTEFVTFMVEYANRITKRWNSRIKSREDNK